MPEPIIENVAENTRIKFSLFTSIAFVCIGIFWICFYYSKFIYPNIPIGLGGAKPYDATLFLNNASIQVSVIGETEDWITFTRNDSDKVERINIDLIGKIAIDK